MVIHVKGMDQARKNIIIWKLYNCIDSRGDSMILRKPYAFFIKQYSAAYEFVILNTQYERLEQAKIDEDLII